MYAYVNETTVQCNTMVLLPFSPLMPTTLLLIRFSCNLEGLLVMLIKNPPKIFLAVALQTKKFFFSFIYDRIGSSICERSAEMNDLAHKYQSFNY